MSAVDPPAGTRPRAPLEVEFARIPGTLVCSLIGDLDPDTCPDARAALGRAVEAHPGVVCLDMRAVTFCGSAGLNLLLGVRALAEHERVPLALVAPCRQVERLLKLTAAERLFLIYPHYELAVDDLGHR
ncbi:STAS domain-containing protein [Streptacidiphilus anmyonensis]|uniref:STAS domain-containing protein n=1 Tax=Streptacidiphilus anmyonensis TaxID=405782 RepID=UPI0013649A62|nr:STAS domain-containing protein [Streptacidiphilus anmyonensis]